MLANINIVCFSIALASSVSHAQLLSLVVVPVLAIMSMQLPFLGYGDDGLSSAEDRWRTACTAVFVPLAIEYLLDRLAWAVNPHPTLHQAAEDDDPLGHWLIISSLVPSSYFTVWLLGAGSTAARDLLIGIGHVIAVYGVLRKLEPFYEGEGGLLSEPVLVLSAYALSETLLTYRSGSLHTPLITISLLCKVCILCVLCSSSRSSKAIYHRRSDALSATFFTDRRYLSTILLLGMLVFITLEIVYAFDLLRSAHLPIEQRILSHMALVLITAVCPGRITRRGLAAVEESNTIMKEMAFKKTFVRYISHEVRSPLSTTSLGLDCLLGMLANPQALNRAELIDLTNDCKATCTTAIQTLSDLLLYDKVESKLMQLEKVELECIPFIEQCVKPLERQVRTPFTSYLLL